MVKEVLALFGWLVVEQSLEGDVLGSSAAQVYLLDAAAVAEEEVLDVLSTMARFLSTQRL